MARKSRYRLRYTFWLDHHDPAEVAVADTIEILKNERSFASTVRDGILLVNDLRQGRVEVLLRLFPWVMDALRPFDPDANQDTAELKRELVALREAVMARESGGYGPPAPKRLAATDDAPELIIQKKSGTDAAANFLASLAALGQ